MNESEIAFAVYYFYNEQMLLARAKFICVILLTLSVFAACRESEDQNSQTSNTAQTSQTNSENVDSNLPSDDVEELEKLIKLPFHPEEATWRTENLNKKRLVAVLKFSVEEVNQIVVQAERYKPAAPVEIEAENWFPAELIAQTQLSGDETLKGNSYAANDFFNPPFADGRITRVNETNIFVLELNGL